MILGVIRARRAVVLLNESLSVEALETNCAEASPDCLLLDNPSSNVVRALSAVKKRMSPSDWGSPADVESIRAVGGSQPSDLWGVLFSSGTTGIPKGIERFHDSMTTEFIGWALELGLTYKTTFYIGRPIYYTGGLVLCLSTLLVGGTVVLNDYLNDSDFTEAWKDYIRFCESHKVSWAFFIPDQLRAFIRLAELLRKPTRPAESILVMGGPISAAEKKLAQSRLGSEIVESWGNSESLGTITDAEDLHARPNSVGRPFLTDPMFIVDERGVPLKAGEIGRLAGSQEAGFHLYCNRPDETNRVKCNDLIISDDLGYQDEDGYFYVLGRVEDAVLFEGQKIFVPAMESALLQSGTVRDCVIVVTNLPLDRSPVVVAFVCLTDATSDDDVEAAVRNAAHPVPVAHVEFVEVIPRLGSGKVDRQRMIEVARSMPLKPSTGSRKQ